MADPAFATARHVDQLVTVPIDGLPMTDVDRIESDLLAERNCLRCFMPPAAGVEWGVFDV